jgi:zinc/manganese transport system substrate-binding protein
MTKNFNASSLRRRGIASFAVLSLAALGLSCSGEDQSQPVDEPTADTTAPETTDAPAVDLPDVVVTYSVLAAVVSELVDGVADVLTIIPDGQDPHDFEPSAKDLETINNAAFVVANGLNFEEGLDEALEKLHDANGPVFFVGEHITVREMEEDGDGHSHGDDKSKDDDHDHGDDDHDHSAGDPHLWLSPAVMLEMMPELSGELGAALGVDLTTATERVTADLAALDTELQSIMSGVAECELVTGHDELGYFADRYGCETIGAVIPSLTTTSEASAGELADLKETIAEHGAKVIFTSLGTPQAVADQIAKETGVEIVELSTHVMGTATSYAEFMRLVANQIADALK